MSDLVVGAMQRGDLKYLRQYIASLRNVNDIIYCDDDNSLNILHLAAGLDFHHREDVIELLIEFRADLNYPGKSDSINNVRALHLAAMWGYETTVKILLLSGADATLRDDNGLSPVDYASVFDNYSCISVLLRYGRLNSTASAWSSIMESSFGDSSRDSVDGCTNSKRRSIDRRSQLIANLTREISRLSTHDISKASEEDELERSDTESDPLDLIKDEELDLAVDNQRLRTQLRELGRNPGPITSSTKRIYAKLLVHLLKEDKELVYSPKTKDKSASNGYSVELNSILTGKFPTKQALDLERNFIRISETKDYHGPKQFFNYILIDPRISQNLPDQVLEMSDSDTSGNRSKLSPRIGGDCENNYDNNQERDTDQKFYRNITTHDNNQARGKQTNKSNKMSDYTMSRINRKFNPKYFTKFLESIFYIGKGQKRRDLMHLYDALADRDSITKSKIDRIRSIWDDGYGVVSLHLFHNITDKEALTREAIMIETIGLTNLTNLMKGSIQFKMGWNDHKRRLLGSLLFQRAYTQLLNEGERQLKRDDLKYEKHGV